MLRLTTPLTRRCLSLEHVCKHTAVNKCANTGRASAERAGWLSAFLAMKQLLLFAVFPPSCVRSLEPRYQIVAAGRRKKNKTPHTHTQLFMLTQHFIGRICQDQFIRHPVNFFTLIWPPNFFTLRSQLLRLPVSFPRAAHIKLRTGGVGGKTQLQNCSNLINLAFSISSRDTRPVAVWAFPLLIDPLRLSAVQLAPIVRTLCFITSPASSFHVRVSRRPFSTRQVACCCVCSLGASCQAWNQRLVALIEKTCCGETLTTLPRGDPPLNFRRHSRDLSLSLIALRLLRTCHVESPGGEVLFLAWPAPFSVPHLGAISISLPGGRAGRGAVDEFSGDKKQI